MHSKACVEELQESPPSGGPTSCHNPQLAAAGQSVHVLPAPPATTNTAPDVLRFPCHLIQRCNVCNRVVTFSKWASACKLSIVLGSSQKQQTSRKAGQVYGPQPLITVQGSIARTAVGSWAARVTADGVQNWVHRWGRDGDNISGGTKLTPSSKVAQLGNKAQERASGRGSRAGGPQQREWPGSSRPGWRLSPAHCVQARLCAA